LAAKISSARYHFQLPPEAEFLNENSSLENNLQNVGEAM
jgi:hypothetical protein